MTDSSPKQEPPYGLRMPPDLKVRVKAAAEANNRSMNAEIVAALEKEYPDPEAAGELGAFIIRFLREHQVDLDSHAAHDYAQLAARRWFALREGTK